MSADYYQEYNFDGLVGPTHNYAGLSFGNKASIAHRNQISHPRKAAIQGLQKMKALADLGVPQAIIPPLERPSIKALRRWGFTGKSEAEILDKAARQAPALLGSSASASSMWAANAATVAPSSDTEDHRLHLTPANLISQLHRSLEAEETYNILKTIFANSQRFCVHPPLPAATPLRDEGAANHTRLTPDFGQSALHLFVHGDSLPDSRFPAPRRFPDRQSRLAGEMIARAHQLSPQRTLFLQQNPQAIDAGVFHNDVIAVGHLGLFFFHEAAFAGGEKAEIELHDQYFRLFNRELTMLKVSEERIPLKTAIRTYLFNTQLLTLPDGRILLVAPAECEEESTVQTFIDEMVADEANPISGVQYFDLRESMQNGGGPACLRQRIVLSKEEAKALQGRVLFDENIYNALIDCVKTHYRPDLSPDDLADPELLDESRRALEAISTILQLPSIYPFQSA